jgi:phosphatidylglycerol lysyltransferase
MSRLRTRLEPLLKAIELHRTAVEVGTVLILASLGFLALHHLLAEVRFHDIRHAFHVIPDWRIAAALGFTTISYLLLTLYDVLALRIVGRPLPYRIAALASFTSYTLSHNLGLALITGGSARLRIYRANGLSAGDVARIIAIAGITFWAGVTVLAAAMLAIKPEAMALAGVAMPAALLRWGGIIFLAATAGAILWLAFRHRRSRPALWRVPLPSALQALAQITLAGADLLVACAALYMLVPGIGPQDFPLLFLAYLLAIIVALISHVPGGLGIFEAVIIAMLPAVDKPQLVAALIAYRAVYYLLPLFMAAVMLAIHEHRHWSGPVSQIFGGLQAVASTLAPTVIAVLTFMGGTMLLISGSLPAVPSRIRALHAIVPLPFTEASHIAASLAGTVLLLAAPGLYRRQDAAFLLARGVLLAGAVFSLFKGIDYEEAAVLFSIAALLQWTRHAFYRHSALTRQSFSPGWMAATALAVGLSLWVGFFAYKHVAYQDELWWQFAWKGDAPRFLRASFATVVVLAGAALLYLLRPAQPDPDPIVAEPPSDERALAASDRTEAMLAFTGDKRFLVSPDGGAFLMYQVQGHSWIMMGDPVGPPDSWPDLMWRIRDMADRAQGRVLFYQLTAEAIPIAIDMGLQLIKYGEEARVDLASFTMQGPKAKMLRYSDRRATQDGASFEIVPAAQLPAIMEELRTISDEWLREKGHGEKAFSIGRFSPEYMARFDCAVVRKEGRIVAFANIWAMPNQAELSVDLMRHTADAPYGTMDFLFIQLMLWGKEQGYRYFSLGIAPLSGLEARRLAPAWARVGNLLYRHGGALYGFVGLRAYKEKFSPTWQPRYIAGPHGLSLVRALVDLQALIGGGRGSAASRARPISPDWGVVMADGDASDTASAREALCQP